MVVYLRVLLVQVRDRQADRCGIRGKTDSALIRRDKKRAESNSKALDLQVDSRPYLVTPMSTSFVW